MVRFLGLRLEAMRATYSISKGGRIVVLMGDISTVREVKGWVKKFLHKEGVAGTFRVAMQSGVISIAHRRQHLRVRRRDMRGREGL